ncbi:Na-translocating system protein MpsC family protein [Lachnospiraceae bacterium 42-17]|nr:DUF2294 family protein [Dorea sp.]
MSECTFSTTAKKQLFEIYNAVNKNIYGFGTNDVKVITIDNLIIFSAHHNRVPCLKALEKNYFTLKESVDAAIMKVFKEQLHEQLTNKMDIHPKAILRDYSADTLIVITVIVL